MDIPNSWWNTRSSSEKPASGLMNTRRISIYIKNKAEMLTEDKRVGWSRTLEMVDEAWDDGLSDQGQQGIPHTDVQAWSAQGGTTECHSHDRQYRFVYLIWYFSGDSRKPSCSNKIRILWQFSDRWKENVLRKSTYSNLLKGTKWASGGSERQHWMMAQLSPSTMSGAEWSQRSYRLSIAIRVSSVCGLGWWDTRSVFSLQSSEDQPLTAACQLTGEDHLAEVRLVQTLRFVEIYHFTCPEHTEASLNRKTEIGILDTTDIGRNSPSTCYQLR